MDRSTTTTTTTATTLEHNLPIVMFIDNIDTGKRNQITYRYVSGNAVEKRRGRKYRCQRERKIQLHRSTQVEVYHVHTADLISIESIKIAPS
jgi:hypothetical protein